MKDISIIIPLYNEEKNILILHKGISDVMKSIKKSYEILFIDDGSEDRTGEFARGIISKDINSKLIELKRNFGQTAAFSAGFDNAAGKIIITMDGDLQNDPHDIPKLLRKIGEGYDVVSGWRYNRKDSLGKKLPSLFSNWLARKLTKAEIHDSGCSLKAYKAEAIKGVRIYGEMHRFIPALCFVKGYRIGEIKVNHHPRRFGKTKYGTRRLINGFLDLMYVTFWGNYSTKPLHLLGTLGIIQYILAVVIVVEQIIKAILIKKLTLGPLLLLSVLFLITGTLFIIFGFILEILIRTYYMKSDEKQYTIKQ